MSNLIPINKSVIPACDVGNLFDLQVLLEETCGIEGIGGYKVGLELVIPYGLKLVVDSIRGYTDLTIIYDHQKGGNDIPELGPKFAKACAFSGVNAVIIFPFAGPVTERAWITACQEEGLTVIVGGHMTHKGFSRLDGGFVTYDGPGIIYKIAADMGVTDFVVPGNRPELVDKYKLILEGMGIKPTLYAPGFIVQGGVISECGKVAGDNWHAIVGSGIYKANSIRKAAEEYVSNIAF